MTQTVTIANDTPEDHSKHEEEMIAKVDKTQQQETNEQTEEQKFAGRYNSVEDLEKGYKELQRELTKVKEAQKGSENKEEESDESNKESSSTEEAEEALENVGLNLDDFTTEYDTNGELTEESYSKLEKAGIPKEVVDSYIAGQEALNNSIVTEIQNTIGGEQNYNAMLSWASNNLSESEAKAFNTATQGSVENAKLAVQGMYARYTQANGSTPNLIDGDATNNVGTGGFQSRAEVTAAMKDARYKTDPAYRKQVEQRIANSKVF